MQCHLSSTSLSLKAGSAMPQRAPRKMTKTWSPPNTLMIRLHRTLILDNQPLRCATTQGSMEVTDCASASRMNPRTLTVYFRITIIAHYMCYICLRKLVWRLRQNVTPPDCSRSARFSIGLW
ncbi:hypothetical protein M405DRAFT_575855 [Rhizopogon salebrosus TDB-379]|nr:hypothetical protein M405DRAFT_575855 [Rhizopogon salebrosus TDB-379]